MQDIKEYLSYDQETGIFTWIKSTGNNKEGSIAGTNKAGYVRIRYKYKNHQAHRLAWWYVYDVFPEAKIDHINEVKSDNRICNLREANTRQNAHNISTPQRNNTSGYRGVSWCNQSNKWRAGIKLHGKVKWLGLYNSPKEASEAYILAKKQLHPFWANLMVQRTTTGETK